MELFEPERHERLRRARWSEAAARRFVDRVIATTEARFESLGMWPAHPDDGSRGANELFSLYWGAAGVVWSLRRLAEQGFPADPDRYGAFVPSLIVRNRQSTAAIGLRDPQHYRHGLLIGDAGVQWLDWQVDPSPARADALFQSVSANVNNPVLEFMWGSPGTMLVAAEMFRATQDDRWRNVFRESAATLSGKLVSGVSASCRVWVQDLFGDHVAHLGAVHGFAGNVAPLVAGASLLDEAELAEWKRTARQTLKATAVVEGDYANWPHSIDGDRAGRGQLLVQHCHGAPGIVNAVGAWGNGEDPEFDALMMQAGELTWLAGPLAKGPGLCHGTAGNGFAFLRLHADTGETLWLERARAFAMHAIRQSELREQRHGDLRYSLWTGDAGVALYVAACMRPDGRFPTMATL